MRSNGEGEVGLSASAPASPTSPRPSPPQGAEREMAAGGDDYAMMREVFRRRFYRALKEDPERERGMWPDLVLIDGGQGQLTQAQAIFAELGIGDVAVVAIAKGPDRNAGRERFFLPGRPAFSLEPRDPVLYFLQRLRDEAHRFAIGVRRRSAARRSTRSPVSGPAASRRSYIISARPGRWRAPRSRKSSAWRALAKLSQKRFMTTFMPTDKMTFPVLCPSPAWREACR